MRELIEISMTELTDTELDAVGGGAFDFLNNLVQVNTGVQVGVALGGALAQLLGQSNFSIISCGCPHTPQLLSAGSVSALRGSVRVQNKGRCRSKETAPARSDVKQRSEVRWGGTPVHGGAGTRACLVCLQHMSEIQQCLGMSFCG